LSSCCDAELKRKEWEAASASSHFGLTDGAEKAGRY